MTLASQVPLPRCTGVGSHSQSYRAFWILLVPFCHLSAVEKRVGGQSPCLSQGGVAKPPAQRRAELGHGLITVFMDPTGISGARPALLSCQSRAEMVGTLFSHTAQSLDVKSWEGTWLWVRWLSEAGETRPSLKGELGQLSVHDTCYSRIIHLLLGIFNSMIKLLI